MKISRITRLFTAFLTAASVSAGAAQPLPGPAVPPVAKRSGSAATQPIPPLPSAQQATDVTTVLGTAWDTRNRPLPNAQVRLRSVTSGRIVAETRTNVQGEFSFAGVPRDTYITELVDTNGDVQAVGDAFAIDEGQTVVTSIRLPERDRLGAGGFLAGSFWGTAAAAALGAAAGAGIMALQACDCPPVSPER